MNGLIETSNDDHVEGFGPVDLYQKREKIFTRYVGGRFQRARFYTGWPLLLGYFLTPWLSWAGEPLVLFDLAARQFNVFGMTFWPQDLWLAGWMLMIGAFALFTVTNVVGRVWCGYTCPQTVWTAIFMWVEQITEGSRHQRIRLDAAPWSFEKVRKRVAKHSLWLGWAALTGLTFVGYFAPIREVSANLLALDFSALGFWIPFWILFFTAATYINAGWMREQVCIYMCPYARFQSAMIDRDTLIVSYDEGRGEPRRLKRKDRQDEPLAGDCINCQLCVQVCPTGIDIRDGLQYQCIGCAHCIDACDQIMEKTNRPPGLIRYTTLRALEGGAIKLLRPRTIGYGSVCAVISLSFLWVLTHRLDIDIDVLRDRGSLYQIEDGGSVSNGYRLKLINKSGEARRFTVSIEESWASLRSDAEFDIPPNAVVDAPLVISSAAAPAAQNVITVRACDSQARCAAEETSFIAPGSRS